MRILDGIPARYVFAMFGFWGMFNVFTMRINISVAIVAMVNRPEDRNLSNKLTECPSMAQNTSQVTLYKGGQYKWNHKTQAMILGSYFYTSFIAQIPSALMVRRYGAKNVFLLGAMVISLSCLLSPLAADLGVTALVITRVIGGFGDGTIYPTITTLISKWTPELERSTISTIIHTGVSVGTMVGTTVSALISSSEISGGWPSSFYFFGGLTCLWGLLWFLFVYESPTVHPRISKEEMTYIIGSKGTDVPNKVLPIPWKKILTTVPLWALVVAHWGMLWGFLICFTLLPTYINDVLHFNLKENGLFSALPYLMYTLAGWLSSFLADRVRASGRLSVSNIRKLFNSIGFFAPALCFIGITMSGCRPYLIVGLFTLQLGFNAFSLSGYNTTHVDMSPNFAGILFSITDTIAVTTGFIGPSIVGLIISEGSTMENWNLVFYITSAVYVVTALVYIFFGSAELQPWNEAATSQEPIAAYPSRESSRPKCDISLVTMKKIPIQEHSVHL